MLSNNETDKKLYQDFLNGNISSFEKLIMQYKNNIIYFIFKYVKNKDVAEDIFEDIIVYLLDRKEVYSFNYSFKTFLYIIAKSKAINYIRSNKIKNEYIENTRKEEIFTQEKLLEEIIFSKERQEKIKNVISKMNDEYQMVIYLAIIEDLSYTDIAKIMNKSKSQIKNLLHRARIKLRKLLIQEKVVEMKDNRVIRFLMWFIIIGIVTSGVIYATEKIYKHIQGKAEITPTYTSNISTIDTNKIWIGSFNLVWNDLMNDFIKGPIEFEKGYSELANELNKQSFEENQISENSYYKVHGYATEELKNTILNQIKEKFNEDSKVLDRVDWGNPNVYVLYAMLRKNFSYEVDFPILNSAPFANSKENVKYFGLEANMPREACQNVEILFYNSKDDFAVKLKTKEGDEVYLYKTTGEGKTFEQNYQEMLKKKNKYTGQTTLQEYDNLKIPFINVDDEINYDELCGKYIKNTTWYIEQAIQTVKFELDNNGGKVDSEAMISLRTKAANQNDIDLKRDFIFNNAFLLYLKENDKDKPYLALKVDNTDVLQREEN